MSIVDRRTPPSVEQQAECFGITPEERQREIDIEHALFDAVKTHLNAALDAARMIWPHDQEYAWTYVDGLLQVKSPPSSPPKAKPKAVILKSLRWEVFKRDDFRCRDCGTRDDLQADHVLAESKGGPTTLDNLQTLCKSCNCKKGPR